MAKARARQAYLAYDQIQPKLDQGVLDSYDLIYATDRSMYYIISDQNEILPVKSRVDTYNSLAEANAVLNQRLDTYRGQIICINSDNEYAAYTVQYNEETGKFYATSVATSEIKLSYNQLSEIPIKNIVANNSDNIILSDLDDGYYNIVGSYKVYPSDETTHIATSPIIYVIRHIEGVTFVKPLDIGDEVTYIIDVDGNLHEEQLATQSYVVNYVETYIESHLVSSSDISSLF